MPDYDQETEHYLQQFRPQPVATLQIPNHSQYFFWRRFAAAAAVTLCAGGLIWFALSSASRSTSDATPKLAQPSELHRSVTVGEPRITLSRANLAASDPQQFEALLTEESRQYLPQFRSPQSTLKILAKE